MKKLILCLLCLLMLCGCHKEEYIEDAGYPHIEIDDELLRLNMLKFAAKEATYYQEIYKVKGDLIIGDIINRYGWVNGRLRELSSPYYIPVFNSDNVPVFYMLIYYEKCDSYAPQFIGGYYCTDTADSTFYADCYQLTDLKDDNYNYYPYVMDMINGSAVVYDSYDKKIYTNNYEHYYDLYNKIDEFRYPDEETMHKIYRDIANYKTYTLKELAYSYDSFHYIYEYGDHNNKEYQRFIEKQLHKEFGDDPTFIVSKPLRTIQVINNADLSVSLIELNDLHSYYYTYRYGKYFQLASIKYDDYFGLEAFIGGDGYPICTQLEYENLYNRFTDPNEFILVKDYVGNRFSLISVDDYYEYGWHLDENIVAEIRKLLS